MSTLVNATQPALEGAPGDATQSSRRVLYYKKNLFLENRMVLQLYLMTSWKRIATNLLIHVFHSFLQTSSLLSASFLLSAILHFQMTSSGISLLKSQRSSTTKGCFTLHRSFMKAQIEKDTRREGFLALHTDGFITG